MENQTIIQEQKSSVKLINGAKGYRWEIKIYEDDLDELLKRLKGINDKMKDTYGGS